MKKRMAICLIIAMVLVLCACGVRTEPESAQSLYADVIARLEAGDYDGARALIDAMEGRDVPVVTASAETQIPEMPVQAETAQPHAEQDSAVMLDFEIVELTKYNIRDYFTVEEEYYISDKSWCSQYIALKEEYEDRLLSVENVLLEVSCLRCEAHGKIDLENEDFRMEYYDAISQEKENQTIELDSNGMGWITNISQFSKRGYFPNYAMDVEIISGSGKLVFSAE